MEKKYIDEIILSLIQIHCDDVTDWDSQQWWLTLFCSGKFVYYTNN